MSPVAEFHRISIKADLKPRINAFSPTAALVKASEPNPVVHLTRRNVVVSHEENHAFP